MGKRSEAEILDILEVSRSKNAKLGITGILVYWARTDQFMQILEGEKKAIFDLLDTIRKDERHTGLKLIYDGEVSERCFTNWSMGFSNFDSIDKTKLEGYSNFLEEGFTDELLNQNPSTAAYLFQSFKQALPEKSTL